MSNVIFRNGLVANLGTVAPANGGTGLSTSYTDGQILVGNSTSGGLDKTTLGGTTNQVVVTNSTGSITMSALQNLATTSTPTFSALTLGSDPLSVVSGGTGSTSLTLDSVILGNTTGNVTFAATTGSGNIVLDTRPTALIVTDGSGFTIQNTADNTKQATLSSASISASTIRTLTAPNFSGTMWASGGRNVNSLQPSFLVYLAANTAGVTGAAALYQIAFDTVSQNVGANATVGYFTGNSTFVAHQTGWYLFAGELMLANTSGAGRYSIGMSTSTRSFNMHNFGQAEWDTNSSPPRMSVNLASLVFMTALETANITIIARNGSGNNTFLVGGINNTWWSATLLF